MSGVAGSNGAAPPPSALAYGDQLIALARFVLDSESHQRLLDLQAAEASAQTSIENAIKAHTVAQNSLSELAMQSATLETAVSEFEEMKNSTMEMLSRRETDVMGREQSLEVREKALASAHADLKTAQLDAENEYNERSSGLDKRSSELDKAIRAHQRDKDDLARRAAALEKAWRS